jgi:hypothetical protein
MLSEYQSRQEKMKLDGQFAQCPAAVECPDADFTNR